MSNTSKIAQPWWPLTLAQLDFWEEFSLYPHQPVSTVAHCLTLTGTIDQPALLRAIQQTVGEADILSVRFRWPEGRPPQQRFDHDRIPQVQWIDLHDNPHPLQAAQQRMQADIQAPLDLLNAPISAQWLFKIADDHFLWYCRGHHIILDGFGMALLEQRCARLYSHFLGQGDAGEPFRAFTDYLEEEENYRNSQRHADDRLYWQRYLDTPVDLPVLNKKENRYDEVGLHFECQLPQTLCRRLHQVSDEMGVTWPDLLILLSAAYLFLHFRPHQPPQTLPVWLPFMSRLGSVGANIPALLVNILPLYVSLTQGETSQQFLKRMARVLRQQRTHGRYRIEQIAIDQNLPEQSRYFFSPLINVLPFKSPVFTHCQVAREVLASGPGDGFNITYREMQDHQGLLFNLDADGHMTSAAEFAAHQRDLPVFLARALSPEGLSAALETLTFESKVDSALIAPAFFS